MFIILLLPVWGTGNKCRPHDLTVICIGVREIFCRGAGAVNHLPKKFSQVSQIFTKESKRNEGHIAPT